MAEHPESMDGVRRATFAYHQHHREAGAHYFAGAARDATCRWCGRSREVVRWGEEAPECSARPAWADESIESVIAREEQQFEKVFARARDIAATIDMATLTGDSLAILHHTHGVDPTILEIALMDAGRGPLPQAIHDAYQAAYAQHRATGKRGLVREILVAKTAPSL